MADEAGAGSSKKEARSLTQMIGMATTSVTAIVGVFVTVNTLIAGMNAQAALQREAFQKAVAAEELYWRNLYNDYLQTFSMESNGNAALKEGKRFTIAAFAARPVPTFAEFTVDAAEKQTASARFTSLQKNLTDVLRRTESSGDVATSLQVQDYENDNATIPVGGAVAAGVAGAGPSLAAAATASLNYDTQLIVGRNGPGWDIDVIWCRGPGEGARYGVARVAAQTLADVAKGDRTLWGGNLLGRVRLRSLPERLREQSGVAGSSNTVVYDTGAAESEVAAAVVAKLNAPLAGRFKTELLPSATPTRWYLSVFVCAS